MKSTLPSLAFVLLLGALGAAPGPASVQDALPPESLLKREEAEHHAIVRRGPRAAEFRELLRQGEFASLEERIERVQRDVESGARPEDDVFEVFHPLMRPDARADVDRWVAARPDSWAAVAARGLSLVDAAARARGGRSAARTQPMQFEQMRAYVERSLPDLRATIAARPRFLPAHARLIDAARLVGDPALARAAFEEARRQAPATFFVREIYITTVAPRWGGSLEAMDEVAREAQAHVGANPRLRMLLGYATATRAYDRVLARDWQGAVDLYTEALRFGRGMGWLRTRAEAYQKLGRHAEAIDDLDEVLAYAPESAEALARRAWSFSALGRQEEQLRDYARAVELAPDVGWITIGHGRALIRALRPVDAASVYDRYLERNPRDVEVLEEAALLHRQSLRQPERALDLSARVIELAPGRASAWRIQGDALRDLKDPRAREVYEHYLEIVDPTVPVERVLAESIRQWLALEPPAAIAD